MTRIHAKSRSSSKEVSAEYAKGREISRIQIGSAANDANEKIELTKIEHHENQRRCLENIYSALVSPFAGIRVIRGQKCQCRRFFWRYFTYLADPPQFPLQFERDVIRIPPS